MKKLFFPLFLLLFSGVILAQLPDSCKLEIGTNLSGLSDYGTELPFVDMMKSAREWYTKDVGNPNGSPFNSEAADSMTFRADGYPTHVPQTIEGRTYPQKVATIWAITNGWVEGEYVILFDGTGSLGFWGGMDNITHTSSNRITFDFNPNLNVIEITIDESLESDPVRNIRVLIPGTEDTYLDQPFNPLWLSKALLFKSFRFMDWARTNNWGQSDDWNWDSPEKFDWEDRQQMDHYTWATSKGIPYEMMIKFMNDYEVDGWVCVPHRASNDYIQNMAELFKENLDEDRKLTVEYSNEIWNWIFGQAQWCLKYGELETGLSWPECTVPFVQNCLDIWTEVYGDEVDRIERVVGIQTGWLDVAQRVAFNMEVNSFDAITPTYYFGLSDEADADLDEKGDLATVEDIAFRARSTMESDAKPSILGVKETIADVLGKYLVFYEGGQHLTAHPFGEEPSYSQALLDIHRDPVMYELYNEWYDFMRTIQEGEEPLKLMNFSFIGERSARYGSWGILETMNQDTSVIYAPKFQSTIENMAKDCSPPVSNIEKASNFNLIVYPNPVNNDLNIISTGDQNIKSLSLFNGAVNRIMELQVNTQNQVLSMGDLPKGMYFLQVRFEGGYVTRKVIK